MSEVPFRLSSQHPSLQHHKLRPSQLPARLSKLGLLIYSSSRDLAVVEVDLLGDPLNTLEFGRYLPVPHTRASLPGQPPKDNYAKYLSSPTTGTALFPYAPTYCNISRPPLPAHYTKCSWDLEQHRWPHVQRRNRSHCQRDATVHSKWDAPTCVMNAASDRGFTR